MMWSCTFVLLGTAIIFTDAVNLPPRVRPAKADRKFHSSAVDAKIEELKTKLKDPAIAILFENCYPNTLDTTVVAAGENDSFVITGDIPAMWLRDSTNQVLPYMMFASEDEGLRQMLHGTVMRQLRSVAIDPYANAFNQVPNSHGHPHDNRKPPMTPPVFEGKYEIDSLAAVMKLSTAYWRATGDDTVLGDEWLAAMQKILDTFEDQQKSTAEQAGNPAYTFKRGGTVYPKSATNRTGLVRSAFRPSDDATTYDFFIPGNLMAVAELEHAAKAAASLHSTAAAAIEKRSAAMAGQLREAAKSFATVDGRYVFEVDGFGNKKEMDDANVPSLLSLPYLGTVPKDDPTYLTTRKWILSSANPYYLSGTVAKGVGSPHMNTGDIWPMSIIIQAMTSTNDDEILQCLEYLKASAQYLGFMHESFGKNNAKHYTRKWFAWANALFGELILDLVKERPHLVLKDTLLV